VPGDAAGNTPRVVPEHAPARWRCIRKHLQDPPANKEPLEVDGRRNPGVVWYYPDPFPKAAMVAGRVAFWKGVVVTE